MIEAGKRETRGPKTKADIRQPPGRGFMDGVNITTTTHIQARWVLGAMEETATWARMKFKPAKSRCLVIKKGKVTQIYFEDPGGTNTIDCQQPNQVPRKMV